MSSQPGAAETRAEEHGKEIKPAAAKGRWDVSGDPAGTARLTRALGQEEVGAGGNELRGAEVAAVGAGVSRAHRPPTLSSAGCGLS